MTTDLRPLSDVERDVRMALCSLADLPLGAIRQGNRNGSTPTNAEAFGSMIVVAVEHANPFYASALNSDGSTLTVEAHSLAILTINLNLFRDHAFDRASLLARLLNQDVGARKMRSLAIGTIEARAVNLSSQVISTVWEERATLIAKFSVMLRTSDIEGAIASLAVTITQG